MNILTEHGVVVLPKRDGRVEIPQNIVKLLNWKKQNKVYIYQNPNELILSGEKRKENLLGITVISNGRIRIPAGILQNTDLKGKPLRFNIADGYITAGKDIIETKLFLLDSSYPVQLFRFICLPFKFFGYILTTKKIILYKNCDLNQQAPSPFYLLPAIKRLSYNSPDRFDIGFLLLSERSYSDVLYSILKIPSKKPDRDIIFMYAPLSQNMFKTYLAPPEDLPLQIVKRAERICSNPYEFLCKKFDFLKSSEKDLIIKESIIVTKKNIEEKE